MDDTLAPASTNAGASPEPAAKERFAKAIEEAKGNYTEAARLLGVHPNYLHRLIRNLNLRAQLKSTGT